MESDALKTVSVVTITAQELADIDSIIAEMEPCGEDGWIPSLRDVEDKLIGRYYERVGELRALYQSRSSDKRKINEAKEELKRMWLFMYWIVETCLDMDPVAYERLSKFVDSKRAIV